MQCEHATQQKSNAIFHDVSQNQKNMGNMISIDMEVS